MLADQAFIVYIYMTLYYMDMFFYWLSLRFRMFQDCVQLCFHKASPLVVPPKMAVGKEVPGNILELFTGRFLKERWTTSKWVDWFTCVVLGAWLMLSMGYRGSGIRGFWDDRQRDVNQHQNAFDNCWLSKGQTLNILLFWGSRALFGFFFNTQKSCANPSPQKVSTFFSQGNPLSKIGFDRWCRDVPRCSLKVAVIYV